MTKVRTGKSVEEAIAALPRAEQVIVKRLHVYFKSVKEINDEQIRALLFEAELVDEGFNKKRNAKSVNHTFKESR